MVTPLAPGPWPDTRQDRLASTGAGCHRQPVLASMLRTLRFPQGYFTYSTGGPGGRLTPLEQAGEGLLAEMTSDEYLAS